jgi:hypothetical protein
MGSSEYEIKVDIKNPGNLLGFFFIVKFIKSIDQ